MYVKKIPLVYHILVLVIGVACLSCATPIAPAGGPRDTEGPKVLQTNPESGLTNFGGRKFEFQFSEFVNRSTVQRSITIEPDLGIDYSIKWKRKTLFIEFEESLPDSTTIILTLGTDISDTKNNKITKPIKIAVSTGVEIDEGSIVGRLRQAEGGGSVESGKVLLYRSPVDLTKPATYQAETDTGGAFTFSYLREGSYKALYVDDRNRNKIWDRGSELALPFRSEFIDLEKGGIDTLDVLYVVRKDTIAPKLQGVGLFSSNRLRLRFNENIELRRPSSITILDSLKNNFSNAYLLFISEIDPFVLFAHSEQALNEDALFSIQIEGLTDASENEALSSGIEFEGSAQSDTTLQRIIKHKTKGGLYPGQSIEILYAAPIVDPMLTDSIVVVEGDVSFDDWPTIRTEKNMLFIDPQDQWIEGVNYQFLVWDPSTLRRKLFTPDIWSNTDLGEINISIEGSDSTKVFHFKLENESIDFEMDSTFSNEINLADLAPIAYSLIVFEDLNGNNEWDYGSVIPFISPEPYYIQKGITVQSGFTSEVIIQF